MNCPTCKRKMVELFLTQRCDWCDFGPDVWKMYRGFVVYVEPDCALPSSHHVFRTRADTFRWKDLASRPGDVVSVLSPRPFRWVQRSLAVYTDMVVVADMVCVVHQNHRYPDAVGEVFLAPKSEGE